MPPNVAWWSMNACPCSSGSSFFTDTAFTEEFKQTLTESNTWPVRLTSYISCEGYSCGHCWTNRDALRCSHCNWSFTATSVLSQSPVVGKCQKYICSCLIFRLLTVTENGLNTDLMVSRLLREHAASLSSIYTITTTTRFCALMIKFLFFQQQKLRFLTIKIWCEHLFSMSTILAKPYELVWLLAPKFDSELPNFAIKLNWCRHQMWIKCLIWPYIQMAHT